MSGLKFEIKRHSRKPSIKVNLTTKDSNGLAIPFDLTDAQSAKFLMRLKGETVLKVNDAAVLEDIPGGVVRYDWKADDVDTKGEFEAEFEIIYTGATDKLTIPTKKKFFAVTIHEDLDNA